MNQEGKISEWNEANFKSMRLHEHQSIINFFKMNPLGITQGKFNYIWLVKNVDILYGEGYSKYSDKEREKVDDLRQLVQDSMKYLSPHKKVTVDRVDRTKEVFVINEDNLDLLMNLLELFEREVKDYNDKHGLTTKNKGTGGLF